MAVASRSIPPIALSGHFKGASLIESTRWYRDTYGVEKLQALIDALPERHRLQGADPTKETLGILPGSWYPSESLHVYCDLMTAGCTPEQKTQMARECAHFTMERTLTGIYRVIFRLVATPERFCAHVQRLWSQNHDSGIVRLELRGRRIDASLGHWRGHHPWVCELAHYSTYYVLEAMGIRNIRSELRCMSRYGGRECTGWFAWDGS